jgi:hypothetical protein
MPRMVLDDVASQHRLYLAAKPSHVGVIMDGLVCPSTVLRYATIKRGDRAFYQMLPCPVML